MKAAFLIRCSTKKQDYDRQVKDLTKLAKSLGYEFDDSIIYGEHITGKDDATKKDRQSIQHLKEGAANRLFDVVLVSEVSRMSRDPTSGRLYIRQLTNMDMPVYFRDIDIWTIDPVTGKKKRDAEAIIGAAFDAAWKYLNSMKTQIASGRRDELDNNCMSIGQPFFGYKRYGGKDKNKKNSWVIDEEAAKVVEEVFNEYIKEGATLKSTALAITAKYGKQYKKKFSIGTIEHILTYDPFCSGIKIVNLKDPDTEEVEAFKVEVPTIINKALFEAVANKRQTNRNSQVPYPKQITHVLSRLIKCPICEHAFTPRKRADEKNGIKYRNHNGKICYLWTCMAGVNNQTDCNSRITLNDEKLESIIWELVKKELIAFANLNTEDRQAKIEKYTEIINNIKEDIANYTVQIANMDKKINKAMNLYMDAPDDDLREMMKDDYYKTLAKSKNEKTDCENKIEGLKEKLDTYERYITNLKQPTLPSDAIAKAESDPEEKRRLVMELIKKIYPYRIESYVSPATKKIIRNGIVVLEVHTTVEGVYNILYDGNQVNNKTAYYISQEYATFQNGKDKIAAYDSGEYFVLTNASMVMDTKELVEFASFNEMIGICEANGWVIDYTYESDKDIKNGN